MTQKERNELIQRYAQGADEVARSLEGFPADGLTAHPIPGKWSAREIIHHLADSESISSFRLRKLLTEKQPVIQGYDQEAYARRFAYNERDHAAAFELFRAVRANNSQILRAMTDEDWSRSGQHSESGAYGAETWLTIYAAHAHDHAAQIRRLREALASGTQRAR